MHAADQGKVTNPHRPETDEADALTREVGWFRMEPDTPPPPPHAVFYEVRVRIREGQSTGRMERRWLDRQHVPIPSAAEQAALALAREGGKEQRQ